MGDIANGEASSGLQRASADAETQLISLWQISDDGMTSLMTGYSDLDGAELGYDSLARSPETLCETLLNHTTIQQRLDDV